MSHAVARQSLNALAARQEALLTRIENRVDAVRCVWKPAPSAWSIAQVVQHLGLSAHATLTS